METVSEILGVMFEIIKETLGFSFKFLNILLWATAGCFILPCVFIAGNIYPKWEKWAGELKK